jgi:hypothetical protein
MVKSLEKNVIIHRVGVEVTGENLGVLTFNEEGQPSTMEFARLIERAGYEGGDQFHYHVVVPKKTESNNRKDGFEPRMYSEGNVDEYIKRSVGFELWRSKFLQNNTPEMALVFSQKIKDYREVPSRFRGSLGSTRDEDLDVYAGLCNEALAKE